MKSKTNPLVSGAVFLAVSGILVKILGLVFKIPLVYIIGEEGMGYFNSAYTIYSFFFILGNSGLPVAISILVCREAQKKGAKNPGGLLRLLLCVIFVVGILGFCVLLFGAKGLSRWIGNPKADICIAVMAPVFLFVCLAGGLRGYFQGMSRMMPTGISQLIEALCKTVLGVTLALYAVKKGYSLPVTAAFSLLGIAIGSFFSMLYLFILYGIGKEKPEKSAPVLHLRSVIFRMAWIALPVTLSSLVMSLSSFIDLGAIMRSLVKSGLDVQAANRVYGNYTALAVPLFNLPAALMLPVATALVPAVTQAKIEGDLKKVGKILGVSLKAVSLISMPCMLALALFSRPILSLLFEKGAGYRAAPALTLLAPALFFVGIVTVTGSFLQAAGKPYLPVLSMLSGALVKWSVTSLLVQRIGIFGAPIGTFACYFVIAVMNLCFAVRYTGLGACFTEIFWKPFGAGVTACLAGFLAERLGEGRLFTLLSLGVVALVYLLLLIVCGVLQTQEIQGLPIPQKIKNFIIKKETKYEKRKGTEPSGSIRI